MMRIIMLIISLFHHKPLATWPVSSPSWSAGGPCPWSRRAACQTVCWPSRWLRTCRWKIQWCLNSSEKRDFFAPKEDLLLVWTGSVGADHRFFSPTAIALQSHLDDTQMEKQKSGFRNQLCDVLCPIFMLLVIKNTKVDHSHIFCWCPKTQSFWVHVCTTIQKILGFTIRNDVKILYFCVSNENIVCIAVKYC